ncbi:MAG TPA: MraY family glycosyltransferase [Terriglobales bacterium]|nr:MraY family glycosyltransferase [Terriglobales bacterium]
MPALLTTAAIAFALCLGLTPLLRAFLARWPPRRRAELGRGLDPKHRPATAIPRLGGVAVIVAATCALAAPHWLHFQFAGNGADLLRQLGWPVLLVLIVGVADDWFNLPPLWKFGGQALAAAMVFGSGIEVNSLFHHPLPRLASAVLTVVWLVACSNAFNLIDGLDGLATGLALFATGTVLAHAVLMGEPGLAVVMGALFGALSGFLLFNFPPASIYLGDAGSLSIGFLLGCMALTWANKANTMVGLMAPFFALLVPMLDTIVAVLRRGLTGQPLFAGDRRHVHHRLLGRGFTPRGAVLVLYAVASLGAVVSLLLDDITERHTFELVILLLLTLSGIAVQQLRYVEFAEFGRAFRQGYLDPRKPLQAQVTLRDRAAEISAARDAGTMWLSLRQLARELGFQGAELRLGSSAAPTFSERVDFAPSESAPLSPGFCGWTCHIPLGAAGSTGMVVFWRESGPPAMGAIEDLTAVLRPALTTRLAELAAQQRSRAAVAGR